MRFSLFIASRYLALWRGRGFLSVVAGVAVGGVALGVAALVVVLGVMNGFSTELRDKLLGVTAHALITDEDGGLTNYAQALQAARAVDGVEAATPYVNAEIMLSTSQGVKGVALRGVDPESAGAVLAIDAQIAAGGGLGALSHYRRGLPPVVMGEALATRLQLRLGDTVELFSPTGRRSAVGFTPKLMSFTVAGVFKTGLHEYDSSLAFVSLASAQSLMGFRPDRVTGVEIKTSDPDEADAIAAEVAAALGSGVSVRHWKEMNANLFAALELEKVGLFLLLAMVVLVGSFSILTTLVMLVMRKTPDIAVLMALGARRRQIRGVFTTLGMLIGGLGAACGFALGLTASWLLGRYKLVALPEDVYPLTHLPVRIEISDLVLVMAGALALCYVASVYPSRHASRLDPTLVLRSE